MDVSIVKKYINEIFNSQILKNDVEKTIVFSGGEPFLNIDSLIKILKYTIKLKNIHESKVKIDINTNLVNLTDELLILIKKINACLFISCISSNKDLYNEITNSNNYDKFIENLKKVINNNLNYDCNIVTNLKNVFSLKETCEFFFDLGVKTIVTSLAHGEIEGLFTKKTYNTYINQCLEIKKKYKDKFGFAIALGPCSIDKSCIKSEKNVGRNLINCGQYSDLIAITPDNKFITCGRQPLNMFIKANTFDEAIIKLNKINSILPPLPIECKNCVGNIICFGKCGHDIQIKRNKECLNTLIKAQSKIKDEKSTKEFCNYFKKFNCFPDEVEYVHENLYYIWDSLELYRKVLNDHEFN